jgi:hypothetical protein
MQHLRRPRHYGPATYAAWLLISCAMLMLAAFSIWSR